jgi:hypothetical protein
MQWQRGIGDSYVGRELKISGWHDLMMHAGPTGQIIGTLLG